MRRLTVLALTLLFLFPTAVLAESGSDADPYADPLRLVAYPAGWRVHSMPGLSGDHFEVSCQSMKAARNDAASSGSDPGSIGVGPFRSIPMSVPASGVSLPSSSIA